MTKITIELSDWSIEDVLTDAVHVIKRDQVMDATIKVRLGETIPWEADVEYEADLDTDD